MTEVASKDRSSAREPRRRVLVSADSHGGAPLGEMEEVAARGDRTIEGEGTTARIGVRVLENAFKKNPEIHPEDRIREADLDGVVAEVVYGFTGIPEGDFADGVRQVQGANDWSAEIYGDYLGRFAPSVCLPLPIERYGARGGEKPSEEHIAAAAAEIRRTKAMGLRPALLPDHCDALPLNFPSGTRCGRRRARWACRLRSTWVSVATRCNTAVRVARSPTTRWCRERSWRPRRISPRAACSRSSPS